MRLKGYLITSQERGIIHKNTFFNNDNKHLFVYITTSYITYTSDNNNAYAATIAINLLRQLRIQRSHFTLQANNCKDTLNCFDILQYSYSHLTLFSMLVSECVCE